MSNTSALEVKIQAVLPESMSSGVMSFLSVTGDWKWMGRLGRLDPGTPEDTQNCASRVLHQTCVRLRLSHSCRENVTAMFRGNFDCSARFARSARIAPLERAYFVVTRGQKACPLTPPQHGAWRDPGLLRSPALAPGGSRLWSAPTSSSLGDKMHVPSLLLSTARGAIRASTSSGRMTRPSRRFQLDS